MLELLLSDLTSELYARKLRKNRKNKSEPIMFKKISGKSYNQIYFALAHFLIICLIATVGVSI